MTQVRWIHLSDIHFKLKNYETDLLRNKLFENIKSKGKYYYKYIFITGDLLNKYEDGGNFEKVGKFLNKIVEESGIEKKNIFIVPGNHDISRCEDTNYKINCITKINDDIHHEVEKMPDKDFKELMKRQEKFINFYEDFLGREYNREKMHNCIQTEDINVLEINSCLLAQSNDNGKLTVHLKKLLESIEELEIDEKKLNVAMLHHEFEWLNSNEHERLKQLLVDKKFDLVFCGHCHKNRFEKYQIGNKELIKICTAALGKDDEDYSDINFVEGLIDNDQLEIIYYKWFANLTQWRRDLSVNRIVNETGIIKLKLDKFKQFRDRDVDKVIICDNKKYKECEEKLGNIYTKETMESKYKEFIKDAKKVYILVKDLDFLNKESLGEEKNRILDIGKNCNIIFQKQNNYNEDTEKLIMEFLEKGVNLKTYDADDDDNIRNIKGQFKLNYDDNYECLVIGKQDFIENERKFKLYDMSNRFLSRAFWTMVEEFFKNGGLEDVSTKEEDIC